MKKIEIIYLVVMVFILALIIGRYYFPHTVNQSRKQSVELLMRTLDNPDTPGALQISSDNTDGKAYELKLLSPNPDIEFIESDQDSPKGKFEIAVQGNKFQINSRNQEDDSFENLAYFRRKADVGKSGDALLNLFLNSPESTIDGLNIINQNSSSESQFGISMKNSWDITQARISSKSGDKFEQSQFIIEVANSSRILNDVLIVDYEGKIIIKPTTVKVTCNKENAGAIYYDSNTNKHYGCNSIQWKAMY